MSRELREARDHARRMVDRCAITIDRIQLELDTGARIDQPAPDPKGTALMRETLRRNQRNARLWSQIADEIDDHLAGNEPAPGEQLDMLSEDLSGGPA